MPGKRIQQAIEAELAGLLVQYAAQVDDQSRRAMVRNGSLPEREILTGVGPAPVIGRLKREWEAEYADWCRRDVVRDRWVYLWVDGIDRSGDITLFQGPVQTGYEIVQAICGLTWGEFILWRGRGKVDDAKTFGK